MTDFKKIFGVDEESSALQSKGSINFGLQENAKLTKFTLNKENQYGAQIEVEITFNNDAVNKSWIGLTPHPDVKDVDAELTNKFAAIKHIIKAVGVTDEMIKKVTSDAVSFEDGVEKVLNILPKDFDTKPIDVFMEWQMNIGNNNDKTYLTLPSNMKGGRFMSTHVDPVGSWVENLIPKKSIIYTDDAGNQHPIQKGTAFMLSTRSYQQFKGTNNSNNKSTTSYDIDTTGSEW